MSRLRTSCERHDDIHVTYRLLRWRVSVNGQTIARYWNRDDAVVIANFLARLAAPSTLVVEPGPGQRTGERREFV